MRSKTPLPHRLSKANPKTYNSSQRQASKFNESWLKGILFSSTCVQQFEIGRQGKIILRDLKYLLKSGLNQMEFPTRNDIRNIVSVRLLARFKLRLKSAANFITRVGTLGDQLNDHWYITIQLNYNRLSTKQK